MRANYSILIQGSAKLASRSVTQIMIMLPQLFDEELLKVQIDCKYSHDLFMSHAPLELGTEDIHVAEILKIIRVLERVFHCGHVGIWLCFIRYL